MMMMMMMMSVVVVVVTQTHDNCSVWRGIARTNAFGVTSRAAVITGVDSSFSCDVHIQQSDFKALVFKIWQDLHVRHCKPFTVSHSLSDLYYDRCHRCGWHTATQPPFLQSLPGFSSTPLERMGLDTTMLPAWHLLGDSPAVQLQMYSQASDDVTTRPERG